MTWFSFVSTRSVTISRLAWLAAIVGLSIPIVACSANSNPLIGSWKFSSTNKKSGPTDCTSKFIFAAKTATITYPPSSVIPAGSVSTMAVTYVTASPTLVAVMTNAAGHVNYNFVDANHKYIDDAWGRCNFERTN